MEMEILASKCNVPQLHTRIVRRPHLIEKLNQGLERKFTLISAPAGFGKSVLLQDWVKQASLDFVWINVDSTDNDLIRLISSMIRGLQAVNSTMGSAVLDQIRTQKESRESIQPRTLVTGLIKELESIKEPLVIILDDFHLITSTVSKDAVLFLVRNLPSGKHLIFSSRVDPDWPLARMRSQLAFNEIREKDLRFNFNETTAFLNGIIGLGLTDSQIALLQSRIEGWIAGLQMASISMKGRDDLSAFLRFFSSSNRYIMDYLTEEVLTYQNEGIQYFLLVTACLDRFNADLCDHLTGQTHSQKTIMELVNNNLFIVPLDERNCWFRYHHLFSDYLRNEFRNRDPEVFRRVNLKASLWWERAGTLNEAISYAVTARDFERADQLISGNIISWISQGEIGSLGHWLRALPESYIWNNLWLALGRIWLAVQAGQFQTVPDLIVGFEEGLSQSGEEVDSRLQGHFNILKAYAFFLMWNSEQVPVQQAIDTAEQALALLNPEMDCSEIVLAKTIIAGAYHGLGELDKAEQAFEEGIRYSKSAGEQLGLINLLGEYADLLLTQGRLHKAYEISQEALSVYKGRGEGLQPQYVGYTHTRLSMIYHQWNQLGDALVHARKGLEISEAWGQLDIIVIGYYQLAKVLGSLGRTEEAINAITKAKQLASNMPDAYRSMVEAWYVRILLVCGDPSAGARWIRDRNLEDPERPLRPLWKSMVLVRVLLAQRKHLEAVDLACVLIDLAESSGANGYLITLLILRARGHAALKANQNALQDLDKALDIAAPENNLQDFVDDGGKAIKSLLETHIAVDGGSSFAAEVMKAFGHTQAMEGASLAEQLIEPLSERELEVLALLATERSPKEIASELFISLSTVNTHIRNIYSKLDVKRRYEAVRLAKKLNLIQLEEEIK